MTSDPFRRVRRPCSGCGKSMSTLAKVQRPWCHSCRRARTRLALPDTLGLCQRGCGQRTGLATETRPERGWVRGAPVRFRPGHNAYARTIHSNPGSRP